MMPSTIILLFSNGCPLRPSFEGSNGSIRSHCSSERARSRDAVVIAIPQPSRQNPLTYGRHALVPCHRGVGLVLALLNGLIERDLTVLHLDPGLPEEGVEGGEVRIGDRVVVPLQLGALQQGEVVVGARNGLIAGDLVFLL